MPFDEVSIPWLQSFADNKEEILNEYLNSKDKLEFVNWPKTVEWNLLIIKELFFERTNIKFFPKVKELIGNCPEDTMIMWVTISEIPSSTDIAWHTEHYPIKHGYKRYHIPLKIPEGCGLQIFDEPLYTWEEGLVYLFSNPNVSHRPFCHNKTEERIVMLIDVFEGIVPEKDMVIDAYKQLTVSTTEYKDFDYEKLKVLDYMVDYEKESQVEYFESNSFDVTKGE